MNKLKIFLISVSLLALTAQAGYAPPSPPPADGSGVATDTHMRVRTASQDAAQADDLDGFINGLLSRATKLAELQLNGKAENVQPYRDLCQELEQQVKTAAPNAPWVEVLARPNPNLAGLQLRVGAIYYDIENFAQALRFFEAAATEHTYQLTSSADIANSGGAESARSMLGTMHLWGEGVRRDLQEVEKWIKFGTQMQDWTQDNPELALGIAEQFESSEDNESAERYLTLKLHEEPEHPHRCDLYYLLGKLTERAAVALSSEKALIDIQAIRPGEDKAQERQALKRKAMEWYRKSAGSSYSTNDWSSAAKRALKRLRKGKTFNTQYGFGPDVGEKE